jgi:hypothetical protein
VIRSYRVAAAAVVVAGLLFLIIELVQIDRLDLVRFFSYFTVQSNLIGVAAFLLAARSGDRPVWVDWLRGASAVYLMVTFVVFALLLQGGDVDTNVAWVDFVLHKVFPIVVLADWLLDPPRHRITARSALQWLVYPLVWVAYTLVRGALTGEYPYPFLDPVNGGYASVAVYIVAIVAFGLLVIAAVAAAGNALGSRRPHALPAH